MIRLALTHAADVMAFGLIVALGLMGWVML